METANYNIKELTIEHRTDIMRLVVMLNPNIPNDVLESRLYKMFKIQSYKCFGIFDKGVLIGLTSCWYTVRYYSGAQIEIDNVVIDEAYRSKGIGKIFLDYITDWAKKNDCETIELNTYVANHRSHKFYFEQGYKILGFHFQKQI